MVNGVAQVNWDKAVEFINLVNELEERYKVFPRTDLLNISNAVETKNEYQFLEHLYWIIRTIVTNRLHEKDERALKVLEILIKDLFK